MLQNIWFFEHTDYSTFNEEPLCDLYLHFLQNVINWKELEAFHLEIIERIHLLVRNFPARPGLFVSINICSFYSAGFVTGAAI